MRGYYLLEEFSQAQAGEAKLLRRFWFDRVERHSSCARADL